MRPVIQKPSSVEMVQIANTIGGALLDTLANQLELVRLQGYALGGAESDAALRARIIVELRERDDGSIALAEACESASPKQRAQR